MCSRRGSNSVSAEWWFLIGVTGFAAFLRLYRLAEIPPGFHFDQAFYVFDIVRLVQGQFAIFFPAPGGSEPLFEYLGVVGVTLFGVSAFGLKLTSAVIGTLFIPVLYGFTRSFLRSRFAAAVAAALGTISIWLIFYSRNGERVQLEALLALLTFWFFWRALTTPKRRTFVYLGVCLALALYTYPAARVLPVILILGTIYFAALEQTRARTFLKGLSISLAIAAALLLPLGVYFVFHPNQFISHTLDVSVLSQTAEPRNLGAVLIENAGRIFKMFFIEGDSGLIRNVPRRPIFDPLTAVLFIVGAMVWVGALVTRREEPARLDHKRAVFLLIWLGMSLALSLVSDDAPNFARVQQAAPAILVLAAWGAWAMAQRLRTSRARSAGAAVLTAMLLGSAALGFNDYFIILGNSPAFYYAFDADKVELANWINAHASADRIFLAPLYYQQGTISLLTRTTPLDSFESRDTIILPSAAAGQDAVYAFPPEQDQKLATLASRLGALGQRTSLTGTLGTKLVGVYHIAAKDLPGVGQPLETLRRGGSFVQPEHESNARWGDNFDLIGYRIQAADSAKRNVMVTLFLQARKTMITDYTFSVRVADGKDRVWGQEDKWAGDNSYATSRWKPGDLIVERFEPGLDACAPAGTYHVTVQAYDPKTNHTLALSEPAGTQFVLGTHAAEGSMGNRMEDLDPARTFDAQIGPQLRLFGFTITPGEPALNEVFTVALYWRGTNGDPKPQPVQIQLRDGRGILHGLASTSITPPPSGRGLCSFFEIKLPSAAAAGRGALLVNKVKLLDLNLVR
jgi:4-amino-4-deoxy-L-arabinose transferase-like glycosyltransferase